ncbi:unnamed protein product [Schistosoma margrebowiei]|uniref:Uncharacterized protein n=1 Tax=Schistosoma margrebowiei TaxID=48269 RepID=A0A183LLH3_9TREM|nr:unnamed protein product [Schistosoma margrebowiei]
MKTSTSEGKHGIHWTSRMQLDDLDFAEWVGECWSAAYTPLGVTGVSKYEGLHNSVNNQEKEKEEESVALW